MFVRSKPSERTQVPRSQVVQVVRSFRDGHKVKQQVVCTLGRLDRLQAEGGIDGIVTSLSRFAVKVRLAKKHKDGRLSAGRSARARR